MFPSKIVLGTLAVILTFIGYIPYISSILKNKTKPHIYSWFIWTLDTLIVFALQISHGAGAGAFVTLAAGSMCLTVLIFALRMKGKRDITLSDKIFTVFAGFALIFWFLAKQPLISVLLIMAVDVFGFVPTIRKSWVDPYTETPYFYALNTFRFALTLIALQQYSVITALYPGVWFLLNGLFTIFLLVWRKNNMNL